MKKLKVSPKSNSQLLHSEKSRQEEFIVTPTNIMDMTYDPFELSTIPEDVISSSSSFRGYRTCTRYTHAQVG